ncbi:late blight resistance homolog R1A-10 isoform X1 [Olea europaea subsp. europaea]|uniref:Late blight resistance homolog R1A-10 isoform X1 n=1 Tax=Olea europaea subsp. europaea TaxID=158383 RepID=A0A8S0QBC5_OLEEU|nr:late blight resistance homolog R1A-10 isoform X1 [Olea europaea subsp. europaea]
MAYAALLSLTQTLEQILGSRNEIRIFHDEKQIRSFHENLCFLLSFLEDSSLRNTESMTCLEARIRDATYEAEDIIELHMSNSACQGVISCFWEIISALQIMMPVFHNSERRLEFKQHNFKEKHEGLQKIIKEIESISEEAEKMKAMNDIEGSSADGLMQINDPLSGIEGIEDVLNANDQNDVLDLRPRNSLNATSSKSASTNKNSMVGFEDDLLQIKTELVGQPSRLKFISIVGMGGIGKTTLARNIYNDSSIEHHFDIQAWITVSQEYRVQELLKHLLKSTGGLTEEMIREETDE